MRQRVHVSSLHEVIEAAGRAGLAQKPESLNLYGEARRGSAMAKARISWELAHATELRGPE